MKYRVAPGWVLIRKPDDAQEKSEGGILLPDRQEKSEFIRLYYGFVVACGMWSSREQVPVETPGWPLQAGSIVEYKRTQPWECALETGTLAVQCVDIVRYWPKGEIPEFLKR